MWFCYWVYQILKLFCIVDITVEFGSRGGTCFVFVKNQTLKEMGEGEENGNEADSNERSLALSPTWSVAIVLTVFVVVSLIVERSIYRLSTVSSLHWMLLCDLIFLRIISYFCFCHSGWEKQRGNLCLLH